VPPSILPAGAQGGTSACSTGAALSFVSCIRLFGSRAAPPKVGNTSGPSHLLLAPTDHTAQPRPHEHAEDDQRPEAAPDDVVLGQHRSPAKSRNEPETELKHKCGRSHPAPTQRS